MAAQGKRPVTITALGVSAKANPDALDDYDLLELISDKGANSFEAVRAIGSALFGEDGWKEVTDGLRDDNGKLPASRAVDFLDAATEQIEALKN